MYIIVTRSFPPEIGGMQNLMWGLACSLAKHNLVKVYADYHKDYNNNDDKVSFSIERIKGVKFLRKYRKAYIVNEFLKKNKNVSSVIADHWKSLELIKTNKKKICLIHSKEINHKKGSLGNKRVLKAFKNIDLVISNSEYTKNLAIDIGIDQNKIIVINPGIFPPKDLEKSAIKKAEEILQEKSPRLITVSRFDKRKNHEKIIMALKNLKQIYPNIVYICIGYGEEEENIKNLSKELQLNNNIIFLKNIDQDLKNALISKSNVFVMPSIIHKTSVEGFGISYVEAAQYGIPSIGGVDGGASDAIKHNETGLICDGKNLNDIYSSIDLILKNNSYLQLGKKAKEYSLNFHWEKIVKDYLKVL
tara:strand:+ start:170 stop:1252 length:1083 start_codon:yes stop_codon:yes gene_type:complete